MKLIPYLRRSEHPLKSWMQPGSLFEEFFDDFPFNGSLIEANHNWAPSVDILEKNGEIILHAELPGMTEKEIGLKLEGNLLTLTGERKMETEEKNNYHRIERFYGTFSRTFTLPESANTENIKAEYKNGILTVTIPQKPETKPREIPVSVH